MAGKEIIKGTKEGENVTKIKSRERKEGRTGGRDEA